MYAARSTGEGIPSAWTDVGGLLLFVRRLVMLRQQVEAEVAVEIAPHAVDVVGVVLRFVELDQKCRRLHAVVVWIMPVDAARPREIQIRLVLAVLIHAHLG